MKIFVQGKVSFLITRNLEMIMRSLSSSAVLCSVTARTENVMR